MTCALASVPIVTAGHVQGGFALFYDIPHRFDDRQLTDLQELATRSP